MLVLIASVLLLTTLPPLVPGFRSTAPKEMTPTLFKRLPNYIRPINYNLFFKPDIEGHTFEGRAVISFKVDHNEPVSVFQIYSSDLDVRNVRLSDDEPVEFTMEKAEERITLKPSKALSNGEHCLKLEFSGILNDKMHGFYRSRYSRNQKSYTIASTQFEPAYARKAFPCWDEPSFKATFDVAIEADHNQTIISNMPVKTEFEVVNKKTVIFEKTPLMSTYLLAFVIGPLEYIEGKDKNGVIVRVYTPLGNSKQGEFALDVACKTLPYYADYFGITYQLPKLDLVAIPDFAAGAMENWGLVTYRETAVLIDPENSASSSKQYVALVVAHELAHQWFGNLVTMDWWTDLWLNEGFASWIEYLAVDDLFPKLDIWTQFVYLDLKLAQNLDALNNSHPIEVQIVRPNDVEEIFDSISYSKGATVIRMLHDFLGSEKFKSGLRSYLERFKFKNAETVDLWKSLSEASGVDVAVLMRAWTQQMGFPLVKIDSIEKQESGKSIVTLSQAKYSIDGNHDAKYGLWHIPITILHSDKSLQRLILRERSQKFEISAEADWFKLNAGFCGMYITAYPKQILDNLSKKLNSIDSVLDRFNLQADLFALCMSGDYELSQYLKLSQALAESETDFTLWRDLDTNLNYVGTLVQEMEFLNEQKPLISDHFDRFKRNLLAGIYAKVGNTRIHKTEDDLTKMLRSAVIRSLGLAGHKGVVGFCQEQFNEGLKTGIGNLDPNLRSSIYAVVAASQNTENNLLQNLMELHQKSELSEEKNRILAAMGFLKGATNKNKVLEYVMSPNVRFQDIFYGFQSVSNSDPTGRRVTWEFFKQNFDTLMERYKESSMMGSIIKRSFGSFCDDKAADEMKEYFAKHPVPIAQRAIEQMIEGVRANSQVLKQNKRSLEEFLHNVKEKDEL